MKEIEEGVRMWKSPQCSSIGRLNIVKILSKAMYRFSEIPITPPMTFFREIEKKREILQLTWKHKIQNLAGKRNGENVRARGNGGNQENEAPKSAYANFIGTH